MSQITIHLHQQLAERLLADGSNGARATASLSRQAIQIVQRFGQRIAYAAVTLPSGESCAMSVRGGGRSVIVEIDPPGSAIPGRGVVRESAPGATAFGERDRLEAARRLKKNRR